VLPTNELPVSTSLLLHRLAVLTDIGSQRLVFTVAYIIPPIPAARAAHDCPVYTSLYMFLGYATAADVFVFVLVSINYKYTIRLTYTDMEIQNKEVLTSLYSSSQLIHCCLIL
jgi:hypothetical protein